MARSRARWPRLAWAVGAGAPFVFAAAMENIGLSSALVANACLGAIGIAAFVGGGVLPAACHRDSLIRQIDFERNPLLQLGCFFFRSLYRSVR